MEASTASGLVTSEAALTPGPSLAPGWSLTISRHSGTLPFHFSPSTQPRTEAEAGLRTWPRPQLNSATVSSNSLSSLTSPLAGAGGAWN